VKQKLRLELVYHSGTNTALLCAPKIISGPSEMSEDEYFGGRWQNSFVLCMKRPGNGLMSARAKCRCNMHSKL